MDTLNPEPAETPPPDLLEEFVWLAQQVAAFRAALELQVWEKMASGARSAQQIAKENGWDIPGTGRLLDALCSLKLMDKDEQGYQLVPVAQAYLIPGASSYMGDSLLAELGWEGNGKLADAIRTGRRPIASDWTSGGMATVWVNSEAPSRLRPEQAIEGKQEIWHLLGIAAREGLRVLDV